MFAVEASATLSAGESHFFLDLLCAGTWVDSEPTEAFVPALARPLERVLRGRRGPDLAGHEGGQGLSGVGHAGMKVEGESNQAEGAGVRTRVVKWGVQPETWALCAVQ